jgi:hypothetical protein
LYGTDLKCRYVAILLRVQQDGGRTDLDYLTIFGLLATLVYPYLANLVFAGEVLKVGLFLGERGGIFHREHVAMRC